MPGYAIHLAMAEEYIKKHKDIKNRDDFFKGVLYPDSVKDKSLTHYGPNSASSDLTKFLKDHTSMDDYTKGHFIHLVSDYLFYKELDELLSEKIYDDYDILNNEIIKKYNVKIPKEIESIIHYKEGKLTYLSQELVDKIIENVSSKSIDEYIEEIKENPQKWLEFK